MGIERRHHFIYMLLIRLYAASLLDANTRTLILYYLLIHTRAATSGHYMFRARFPFDIKYTAAGHDARVNMALMGASENTADFYADIERRES